VKGSVVLAAFDGEVASLLGATPADDEEDELEDELEDGVLSSFEGAVPDLGVSVVGGGVVVVDGGVVGVGGGVL